MRKLSFEVFFIAKTLAQQKNSRLININAIFSLSSAKIYLLSTNK